VNLFKRSKRAEKILELSSAETTQQTILHGNKYDNRQK
jgi:hypothetical protein